MKKAGILILFIVILIHSCKKDKYNLDKFSYSSIDQELGAPLVTSELTIREVLAKADKNNNIQVDGTGFCTLIYRGTLFTSYAKDFISVPDQTIPSMMFNFSNTSGLAAFNAAPNGTNFGPYTQTQVVVFSPTPPYIDSVYCDNGTLLNVTITNNIPATITFTLSSQSVINLSTNQPFNQVITVTTNTSVSYNLSNHLLKLNDGVNRSRFYVSYSVSMNKTGNAVGTENMIISMSVTNIKYKKFIGFLGNNFTHPSFAPYKDTVPLTIFKSTEPTYINTVFYMVDPKFQISFYNEIGSTALLNFTKLNAYTPDANGNNINFNTLSGSPVIQNLTILKANNFNAPVTTTLNINKNNEPNVVPFINSRPKNVIYEVNGVLNPGNATYIRNFVTDTSRIRVDLDVILPFWGNMKDLVFLDTNKVDLSGLDVNNIRQATIRTYFESTFPIDMGTEIVFTDTLNNTLFTLVQAGTVIIKGAVVNNNGVASQPAVVRKDYVLTRDQLAVIRYAKKIRVRAFANTTNYPQYIKIYDFQKLKVKLGLAVKPYYNNN